MNQGPEVFKLYANCMPVKGARRSIICDLQKQRLRFIPNNLFYILTELADHSVADIKQKFEGKTDQTIDDYFALLVKEDYGFWCDEPENFLPLDLTWDRPEAVTNSIIDIDSSSCHDYTEIFTQLDGAGLPGSADKSLRSPLYESVGGNFAGLPAPAIAPPGPGYQVSARVDARNSLGVLSSLSTHFDHLGVFQSGKIYA